MASAVAAILALGVVAVTIPHQAKADGSCCNPNPCCDPAKQPEKKIDVTKVAVGGNGGSGGAGGAGGEGGQGGTNTVKNMEKKGDCCCCKDDNTKVNQKADGGNADGGRGGNANGGNANA